MTPQLTGSSQEIMPIALCADKHMELGLHVTALSALDHLATGQTLRIYLFSSGFGPEEDLRLRSTLDQTGKAYELIQKTVDPSRFKNLRGLFGNHMTYARLLMPDIIDEPRFSYVDVDTVVLLNLADLHHFPLNGRIAGFVEYGRCMDALEQEFLNELGFPGSSAYFNAGIMTVDTVAWRSADTTNRCLEFANKYPNRLLSVDQTVLNCTLFDQIQSLPLRFNFPSFPGDLRFKIEDEPCIIHYVGAPKPWDPLGAWIHPNYKHMARFAARSKSEQRPAGLLAIASHFRKARSYVGAARKLWASRKWDGSEIIAKLKDHNTPNTTAYPVKAVDQDNCSS